MDTKGIKAPKELLKAQRMANLLDTAITLPVVKVKLGLDFLIGLIPGAGDAVMLLAALRIIMLGRKLGVPKPLLKVMVRNSVIDFALGFVPVVGDVVDIFFKANQKNVRIMEKWWITENKANVDEKTQELLKQWEASQDKR